MIDNVYQIDQLPDGAWAVTDFAGNVLAKFRDNEPAWRWIDRNTRFKPWDSERKDRV
jgi:hypothetical protein